MQIKRIGLGLSLLTRDEVPEVRLTYHLVEKDGHSAGKSKAADAGEPVGMSEGKPAIAKDHLPDLLAAPAVRYEPGTGTGTLVGEGILGHSPDEKTIEKAEEAAAPNLRAFDVPFDLWASGV